MTGRFSLILNEDPTAFETFSERLLAQLAPVGGLEVELAGAVVQGFWRLRRIQRMEAETMDQVIIEATAFREKMRNYDKPRRRKNAEGPAPVEPEPEPMNLGESALWQWCRSDPPPDRLAAIYRYEAHIERGLYRALRELRRLQADRREQPVPEPAGAETEIPNEANAPAAAAADEPAIAAAGAAKTGAAPADAETMPNEPNSDMSAPAGTPPVPAEAARSA